MEFRPCIDIHNGKVKQIVGGSLRDEDDWARENFVASQDADYFAELYRRDGLYGGHIILLNPTGSSFYKETREQAIKALRAFPGGMQIGGGINPDNAKDYLEAGASHVIVTSYVFRDGQVNYENLKRMVDTVGRERLVLDVSCRKREDGYYVVTDRWQKFTQEKVNEQLLERLWYYTDEFLVHAVDVEGKSAGIDTELVQLLSDWKGCPITYAGGVRSLSDLELLYRAGQGRIHATIGSALDLFGGQLAYEDVLKWMKRKDK